MNAPRYRAWRFSHPDFEDAGVPPGLRVSNRGGVEMVDGGASIQQAILLLLSTPPGERVMRPHYGCNLRSLVFSPNDDTTAGLCIHYVRQAIARWEPRIDVLRLDATRSTALPGVLEIDLEYRVRATQQTENLTYAFDLSGEKS